MARETAAQRTRQAQLEWARQREMTPAERYALGPTGDQFGLTEYRRQVMPYFLSEESLADSCLEVKTLRTLARAGVIDGERVPVGKYLHTRIRDTIRTRQALVEFQQNPTRMTRMRWLKSMSMQHLFAPATHYLITRMGSLIGELQKPGWERLVDDRGRINIGPWLGIGYLVDSGQLPIDYINVAMRLAAGHLLTYLATQHPSKGRVVKQGEEMDIWLCYGTRALVHSLDGVYVKLANRMWPRIEDTDGPGPVLDEWDEWWALSKQHYETNLPTNEVH